jgi:Zn-dependent protease/predicted transcriptional regulator
MKWSWQIARVAGIGIYVHVTFAILPIFVGVGYFLLRDNWLDAVNGLVLVAAMVVIIVMHELGHALTAKRFGIRTRDITLLPIGGIARLERMPEDPLQELLVALAGPAVNVVLAAPLYLGLLAAHVPLQGMWVSLFEPARSGFGVGNLVEKLMWVNVMLAVFNMLPAFPMDGGRVLRALLATRMEYVRATQIAATIGQAMALVFGFFGSLHLQPFLLLIALFVWMGAAQESSMVQMKKALGGIPVKRLMITEFHTLSPGDTLGQAIEHVLAGTQQDFPVVDEGRVAGVLTRDALLAGLAKSGPSAPVGTVMETTFETADPYEMVENVFVRLQSCECRTVPVLRGEKLVGIVTMENVAEFLMIEAALHGGRTPSTSGNRLMNAIASTLPPATPK